MIARILTAMLLTAIAVTAAPPTGTVYRILNAPTNTPTDGDALIVRVSPGATSLVYQANTAGATGDSATVDALLLVSGRVDVVETIAEGVFMKSGYVPMEGDLNMGGTNNITNAAAVTAGALSLTGVPGVTVTGIKTDLSLYPASDTDLPTVGGVTRYIANTSGARLDWLDNEAYRGVGVDFLQNLELCLLKNRDTYNVDGAPIVTFATSMAGLDLSRCSNYFYSASGKFVANYVTNGACLRFDGTNDAVHFPAAMMPFTNNFTISFWVRILNASNTRRILGQGATGDGNSGRFVFTYGTSGDRLYIGSNLNHYVTSSGLGGTNWNHIAWTVGVNPTSQTVYINGLKQVFTHTASIDMPPANADPIVAGVALFGATNAYASPMLLDELHIAGRELSSNEVASMLNGGLGEYQSTNADSHALFHFEEATGSNTYDASINGYVGKLTNGVVWAAGERANRRENFPMTLATSNFVADTTGTNFFTLVALEPVATVTTNDFTMWITSDGWGTSQRVTVVHDALYDSGTRGIFVGHGFFPAVPTNVQQLLITNTNGVNVHAIGVQL